MYGLFWTLIHKVDCSNIFFYKNKEKTFGKIPIVFEKRNLIFRKRYDILHHGIPLSLKHT